MSDNFVMSDIGVMAAAEVIEKKLNAQDEIMEEYLKILDDVQTNSIKSGAVHDAIVELAENARYIHEHDCGKGKSVNGKMKSFISRIDKIDLKLYGD